MASLPSDYIKACAPVSPLMSGGAVVARVECAQCGAHSDWRINTSRPPPEVLPKHFANKGWRMSKKPLCPDCQSRKETPMTAEKITALQIPAVRAANAAPSDAARRMRTKAVEHLVAYFDPENGKYEDGWSDEIIAKETGLPVAWVTKRREEDFGPLKEPGEFQEIRSEVSQLASEIGKLTSKLDAMAKRNGWAN